MKTVITILNITIALYFFFIANMFFWGSVLGLFIGLFAKQEYLKNPFPFFMNILLAPFLIYACIIFFQKSFNKYIYGMSILAFMLIETQIYRFFFVTNNTFEMVDAQNVLFFGVPFGIVYLTKYLDKKSLSFR